MAPRKRVPKALSAEDETKRKKLVVYLADLEKQSVKRALAIERSTIDVTKQIRSYYIQEILKLPKAVREMKVADLLAGKAQKNLTDPLGQIEEEINNAIQLPTILAKKLCSATKAMPTPSIRPDSNLASSLLAALAGSPVADDKLPQLEPADIDLVKKLQNNLARIIEVNQNRVKAEAIETPGCSSKAQ